MFEELLGIPFKEGGCDPSGFDCRGLVLFILRHRGIDIQADDTPQRFDDLGIRDAMLTQALAMHCEKISDPEPWAVVTFWIENPKFSTHMGIIVDNGYEFIHITRNASVSIERLDSIRWKNKATGFYRVKK